MTANDLDDADPVALPEAFGPVDRLGVEKLFQRGGVKYGITYVQPPPGDAPGPEGGSFGHLFHVAARDARLAAELLYHYLEFGEVADPDGRFTGACDACGSQVVAAEVCPDCGLRFANYADDVWTSWFRSLGFG